VESIKAGTVGVFVSFGFDGLPVILSAS